ncbi:putative ATP-grasp-modified RiPP [Streptomyces sp. UNOC14_S4]|uniref:putative ATP-grasp-modified RiPP n=1 Tax=Streptomyces sp. UNOC14_S4 TaxID=2872340 RepID=UPI001E6369E3|nr:putative ATP-grasp-modified RiPP [Streptomyces sp. UNOC14_S4]
MPHVLPWGLSRMEPFPASGPLPQQRLILDPVSQIPTRLGPDGLPVPATSKHRKSNTGTETNTTTGDRKDGPDQGHDQDSDTD